MKRRRPTKEQFLQQLDHMVATIRNDILEGKLQAGHYLPAEKMLEKQFGMSNNSIRIALDQLVREGWIEKIPRVGNKIAEGRPPVHLTLAYNSVASRNLDLDALLQAFQKQYPWITVKRTEITGIPGYDVGTQKNQGDVFLLDDNQFQTIVENGMTSSMVAFPQDQGIYPQLMDMFSYEGILYAKPVVFSPIVLCYNKAHFRERGLIEPNGSWTWEDLMRNAEMLSDGKGRYGFCYHIVSSNRWPLFLLQSGERFEWIDGRPKDISGTHLLEAMRMCMRIIHNKKAFPTYMSENNDDIDRMFVEGKVSMILTSYMGLNGWKGTDVEYDVSPVPFMIEPRTLVISLGVAVKENSPHKEEAKLLADFMTSEQAQLLIQEQTLSIPARGVISSEEIGHRETARSPIHHDGLYRPSRYWMFKEIMSSFRPLSELQLSYDQLGKVANLLKAYWAQMMSEEELCDRIRHVLS